ncbi:DUF3617 domain-containing protein [Methylopila musalis]|uniref:DUF3617 domain-containing protein n=1 Tax=Methylopila musalis TaxID=1134781 RepID=A0ABW3ZBC6_9HYPH
MTRARTSIAFLTLIGVFAGPALAAEEIPARAPGLWESVSRTEDGVTTARQCIDATTDRKARETTAGAVSCTKNEVTRTADGYATETLCKVGPLTAEGRGRITGDFTTSVTIETTTTLTGLPDAAGPTVRKTVIENRRVGDCGPGQKPGDIILEDGSVAPTPGTPR